MSLYSYHHSQQPTLAGYLQVHSERGRLFYLPDALHQVFQDEESQSTGVFQTRGLRPHRIHIARVAGDRPARAARRSRNTASVIFTKLAGSKDSAKRFFRFFISPSSNSNISSNERRKPKPGLRRRPLSWAPTSPSFPVPARRQRPASTVLGTVANRRSLTDTMRPNVRHSVAGPIGSAIPHSVFANDEGNSSSPALEVVPNTGQRIPDEKPIASGGGVSVSIALAEPVLFLQGYEQSDLSANPSTAMLRGSLHLKITKPSKIKMVTLKFRGRAVTKWPEGIPPKKNEFEETVPHMSHTWPFFNAQFPTAEYSTGADHIELQSSNIDPAVKRSSLDILRVTAIGSNTNLSRPENKRLSLQSTQSPSIGRNESSGSQSTAQRGYRTFQPGDYIYNFELPLDSHLPETINVDLGYVKYELEATIERAGAFRGNLQGTKEVVVIRTPAEGSLEQVEPIAISRNWEDQLHYDIVISGKSFPLGSQVPIAFKLTPLAKVQCHRIKVFVTESIEYFCNNRRVHRTEPPRKFLLFEKRADGSAVSTFSGSSMRIISGGGVPYDLREAAARGDSISGLDPNNILGNLEHPSSSIGPTEMEINVQLPGCPASSKDRDKGVKLHCDTTYTNIQVHHWIKIVLRLSKPDATDSSKRRHFEISIDSPFHILSCLATQANTSLPAYASPQVDPNASLYECGCPGAPIRRHSPTSYVPTLNNFSSTRDRSPPSRTGTSSTSATSSTDIGLDQISPPQRAHISGDASPSASNLSNRRQPLRRPMHILRAPSYNPPSFDAEEPPPPLETPPPNYDTIASPTTGLADYFSRLSDAYSGQGSDGSSEEEEEDGGSSTPTGRPLSAVLINESIETNTSPRIATTQA